MLLHEIRSSFARLPRANQRIYPQAEDAMVKLNKIYTKQGDDGTTGLVGGARGDRAWLTRPLP